MSSWQERLNLRRHGVRRAGEVTYLLAHGYGCHQGIWAPLRAEFGEDVHLLSFDWPGAGGARAAYDPERHRTLDGYACDLLDLGHELTDAGHRLVYVGHSMAATCGLLAALAQPGLFEQLVLVTPSPCFVDHPGYRGGFGEGALRALVEGLSEGHHAWARAVAPIAMGHPERPQLAAGLGDMFCALDPTIALRWARATFYSDVRDQVPRVRTPAVILQCRDDALAPSEVGEWMHERMPRSQLLRLQATGHCPHVSAPGEVAAALRQHARGRERHGEPA